MVGWLSIILIASIFIPSFSNIESNLYGIKQIDLTTAQTKFVAQLNKLPEQKFFKTPRVFVPEPLVVQKNQRPVGPFSGA